VYSVTLTLTGFSTVKREGIQLAGDITLTINTEMRVGGVEETITVPGQSPLIHVQSATQHHTISQTQLENLPTARQWFSYLALVPGVSASTRGRDVSGSTGDQSQALAIHGSIGSEMSHNWDGMRWGNMFGTGGDTNGSYPVNSGMGAGDCLGQRRVRQRKPMWPACAPTSSPSKAAIDSRAISSPTT
jgi:hypothetical protein